MNPNRAGFTPSWRQAIPLALLLSGPAQAAQAGEQGDAAHRAEFRTAMLA